MTSQSHTSKLIIGGELKKGEFVTVVNYTVVRIGKVR
jgi:hypothetical protein